MTSYQRRKEEIKALKEQLRVAQSLAQCAKAYILAEAREKVEHIQQSRRALVKRLVLPFARICDSEYEEIKKL